MVDRILFLGTAGSKEAVGKQLKGSGGIVIESGMNQFMIDPGPGCLAKARSFGINPRANTAIIVTHTHLGHCNDLNALIDATTLGGEDRHAVLLCSKSVIEGTENLKPLLLEEYKEQLERAIVLEPGKKVGINEVEIVSTKTKHSDETCIGFKVYAQNYTIGYTSDTQFLKEVAEQYNDVDVLIVNMKEPLMGKNKDCLNGEDVVKILEVIEPKLTVLTHFGTKVLMDPIQQAREIQRSTKCQVVAAKDGMAINPTGFARSMRQQKLKQFSEETEEGSE